MIRFVNRRDWLVTKHLVPCELHFEEKHLRQGEKMYSTMVNESCTFSLSTIFVANTAFQQRDIIRTFQHLSESIAPGGFQLKELENCIIFSFSF